MRGGEGRGADDKGLTRRVSNTLRVEMSSLRSLENLAPTEMKPFFAGAAGCSAGSVKRVLTSALPTPCRSQRESFIESLLSSRKLPAV